MGIIKCRIKKKKKKDASVKGHVSTFEEIQIYTPNINHQDTAFIFWGKKKVAHQMEDF